jgi:two-component system response regulator YesN
VCIFPVKHIYIGNPKVAQAKKYIDEHWLDAFDDDAVAKAVNMSTSHVHALFRKHACMTMYEYYKSVKVDHIKEKLRDKSLSITEVFSFCGEDSRGSFARTFKKLTGMTPKAYRNSLK